MAKFQNFLDALVQDGTLTVESKLSEIEAIHQERFDCNNSQELTFIEKEDLLIAYKDVMDKLLTSYKTKKLENERIKRKQEVKNRMEFRTLMSSLVNAGKVNQKTVWLDIYPIVCQDPSYTALLSQHGATPVDIFGEFMYKILKNYWYYYTKIKKLLTVSYHLIFLILHKYFFFKLVL